MSDNNFLSVFGEYIESDVFKSQMKNVRIENMSLFTEKRNLSVIFFSESLISPGTILKIEKQIKIVSSLHMLSFCLSSLQVFMIHLFILT